jgi:hypothetical protein
MHVDESSILPVYGEDRVHSPFFALPSFIEELCRMRAYSSAQGPPKNAKWKTIVSKPRRLFSLISRTWLSTLHLDPRKGWTDRRALKCSCAVKTE